jgi:uncharacterized protein YqgV (UPF0045/DUF77 family)
MAIMKINFSQLDTKKINGVGKFVTSLILLSNEKGIKCRLTSTGLIIEGDMETLLEILEEFDNTSFRKAANLIELRLP